MVHVELDVEQSGPPLLSEKAGPPHPDDAILALVVRPLASSSSHSTWEAWGG